MLWVELVGWALMSLSALLLGVTAQAGVTLMPDGRVVMGNPKAKSPEHGRALNIRRYRWQKYGSAAGWISFGIGSLCQLLVVLFK
ncbi:hypothetical protein [Stenotrophomonas maltophilia]